MTPNRYPAYCLDCRQNVTAGHGELVRAAGKRWTGTNGVEYQARGGYAVRCKSDEQRAAERQAKATEAEAERAYHAQLDEWLRAAFAADKAGTPRPPLPEKTTMEVPR